ncbi:MAG: hypothetical protein ACLPT6_11525 [Desulfobaccales bacterium]
MKNLLVVLAALLFFAEVLAGCGDAPAPPQGKEQPIAVIKQHDTRMLVVCKDNPGHYSEKSLNNSESITCGDVTYKMEDYAKICKRDCYIALPGKEKELEEYLNKVNLAKKNNPD